MLMIQASALRFWLLVFAGLVALLWLFNPVLFPFFAGIIIAYFLEPAVTSLEKRGVRRWLGALTVLSIFLIVVVSIFSLLWPMLNAQIGALVYALPEYISQIRGHYLPWVQNWLSRFSPEDMANIRNAATQSTGEAVGLVGRTLKSILSGGSALIDAVALFVLTPITAFYVLRDWTKMTKVIDELIPRSQYAAIREQMTEIDQTLSGFLRGQAFVCLILGFYYSVALALSGLQYGATVGIIAGVLTIIPYVGTIFGWVTSLILAFAQFSGDWVHIGAIIAIFIVGNIIETYVLSPRLVGSRVKLHTVWVLFALVAGAELMGFTGILIAVPCAAVLGVLVRFGAKLYKSSPMYR